MSYMKGNYEPHGTESLAFRDRGSLYRMVKIWPFEEFCG